MQPTLLIEPFSDERTATLPYLVSREGEILDVGPFQLDGKTSREGFIAFRKQRDAQLGFPVLILLAVQVNVRAGALPESESNGTVSLRIPVHLLGHPV